MPRSSGTMMLVAGNPVISGSAISSTVQNNTMNDVANEITNSIPRDGSAPPTANLPLGNFKITGLGAATLATDVPQYQQIQSGATNALTAVSGTNTIVATLATPTLTSYVIAQHYTFIATGTNTAATTVNINAIGAKPVTQNGVALSAGDITTGLAYELIYDGTNMQLVAGGSQGISAAALQAQTYVAFTTTGTSDTFLGSTTPALTALVANKTRVNITFHVAPTSTPTLTVNAMTTSGLRYVDSAGVKQILSSSQVIAGFNTDAIWDGTYWLVAEILPAANLPTASFSEVAARTSFTRTVTPQSLQSILVQGTAVASTSGTTVDFTGIPSWAKRITVMFNGVSTNGTSLVRIQIGKSAGIENTGYLGASTVLTSGLASGNSTAGWEFFDNTPAAADIRHGAVTITLLEASSNTWVISGVIALSDSAQTITIAGSKPLAGTLDRIRLTTVNGTDLFDAGLINILYE